MNKALFLFLFAAVTLGASAQNLSCYSLNVPQAAAWTVYGNNGETITQGVTPEAANFCLPSGCFQIYIESIAMNPLPLEVTIFDENANPVVVENQGNEFYFIGFISNNGVSGCTDPNACNFNPEATCYDYLSCDYSCQGCTNPNAFNYNPNATVDNGTCCLDHWATFTVDQGQAGIWLYSEQYFMTGGDNQVNNQFCVKDGCYTLQVYSFDSLAVNQNFLVTLEDGSTWLSGVNDNNFLYTTVSLNPVYGCADPNACNYTPGVTCNDGTCEYASCSGCTDPTATNYDPTATFDDGKCCYGEVGNLTTSVPSYYSVQNSLGYYQYGQTPADSEVCLYDGCYTLNTYPIEFDPANPNGETTFVTITDAFGNLVSQGTENSFQTGIPYTFIWGIAIPGCTEPSACNYNPEATCGEFASCDYSCQGCTDPSASNYNPDATIENGMCCYNSWYTIETSSWVEWYVTTADGLYSQGGYTTMVNGFCVDQDCFTFSAWSLTVQPFDITIYAPDGSIFYQSTGNVDPYITEFFSLNEVVGCTDAFACNYNPNATCANYSLCDYSCYGCTDPSAPNYNANATIDNGTCCTTENWNTITADGQVIFYAYNPYTGEGDYNEYPYAQGYCMSNTSCYQLILYSFEQNTNNVTVTNASGEVVVAGDLANFAYLQTVVSTANEVAGCTDPSACNYDSNATCDVGSCVYYCGGCTDPLAWNYNPDATFDDGTCFYNVELPNMGMTMVTDEVNNQFYVLMDLASMGTGGPYGVVSSLNEPVTVMNAAGQSLRGPYACGTEVQFQVHDMGNGMQAMLNSPVYTMACGVGVEESANTSATPSLYPNPARDLVQVVGLTKNSMLEVIDVTGRTVYSTKVSSEQQTLNTSSWTAGIYLVRTGQTTLRLVKQ